MAPLPRSTTYFAVVAIIEGAWGGAALEVCKRWWRVDLEVVQGSDLEVRPQATDGTK